MLIKSYFDDSARNGEVERKRPMKLTLIRRGALPFVALLWVQSAEAHGIAGNRYFDCTLAFDDPAVADEAILPLYQNLVTVVTSNIFSGFYGDDPESEVVIPRHANTSGSSNRVEGVYHVGRVRPVAVVRRPRVHDVV